MTRRRCIAAALLGGTLGFWAMPSRAQAPDTEEPPPPEPPPPPPAGTPAGATDGPNLALVVVGAVVGSTAYLAAVVTGAVACAGPGYMCERYGPLFIPLAGPFVALGTGVYDPARDDSPWPGMHVPIAIDGALQLAGAALLLAGLLMHGGPTGDAAVRSPWRPSVRVAAGTAQAQWTF